MDKTGSLLAAFRRLPRPARFYSVLSVLVAVLGLASGLSSHRAAGQPVDLNPRAPIFRAVSPWGRVLNLPRNGLLESPFEILGVLTPVPEDAASYSRTVTAGVDLGAVAAQEGIDLDLLAGANSSSYARVARRASELVLPLLYSRDRSWDRSLEFLYPSSLRIPVGGNLKARAGAPKITKHAVAPGECLWVIARKYHVKMETILAMNDLPSARYLKTGQVLEVPDTDGSFVVVRRGDTVEALCKQYGIDITQLVNANPGVDVARLIVNQKLFVPGLGALEQIFRFIWPVHGRLSSRFGHRYHPIFHRRMVHTGLDIAAGYGTAVHAAMDGRVTFVGSKGGYGRTVILEHVDGYETLYGHCSKILVKRGQTVKKGQTIAKVGSSGYSTGPHVHFEVRRRGKRVDPEKLLG